MQDARHGLRLSWKPECTEMSFDLFWDGAPRTFVASSVRFLSLLLLLGWCCAGLAGTLKRRGHYG